MSLPKLSPLPRSLPSATIWWRVVVELRRAGDRGLVARRDGVDQVVVAEVDVGVGRGHRGGRELALAVGAQPPRRVVGAVVHPPLRRVLRHPVPLVDRRHLEVEAPVGRRAEPRHARLQELPVRLRLAVVDRRDLRDVARLRVREVHEQHDRLDRPDRPRMRDPVGVEPAVRVRVPVVLVEVRRPEPVRALDLARVRRVRRRPRGRARHHQGHEYRGQRRPSSSAHPAPLGSTTLCGGTLRAPRGAVDRQMAERVAVRSGSCRAGVPREAGTGARSRALGVVGAACGPNRQARTDHARLSHGAGTTRTTGYRQAAAHPRHSVPPRCLLFRPYVKPVVTCMPAATGVTHERTATPSTNTRHSWQTPIPQ